MYEVKPNPIIKKTKKTKQMKNVKGVSYISYFFNWTLRTGYDIEVLFPL